MNTKTSPLAEYALSPGTPALQTDPDKLHRGLALCALALICLAVSLGYILGRSLEPSPSLDAITVQR